MVSPAAAAGPINASGLIPTSIASQITAEAVQQSMALALGNRVPMPAGVSVVPVPKTFPKAGWVRAGGRKPFTDFTIGTEQIEAEEVAAIISIPQVYLDDSTINLWNYARPLLAEAIAVAVDDAILWGVDAPPSFPAGGIAANATVIAPSGDPIETINAALSAVEVAGLRPTGSAADLAVRGALRGVRDNNGAFLLAPGTTQQSVDNLYGVPIRFESLDLDAPANFITGDWSKLYVGVRQDVRYQISDSGVIADDNGKVIVSAFQDDQVIMRVWARYGCVVMRPVTRRSPNGAEPFAMTDVPIGGGSEGGGDALRVSAAPSGDTGADVTAAPTGTDETP